MKRKKMKKAKFYGNKLKAGRNKKVVEMYKKGLGYKAIGKVFDIHFTRVKQILQEERVREQA